MQLRAAGSTDRGQQRPHNEDAFAIDPQVSLFVVCDGMGGEAAGEVASQLATATIVSQIRGAEREVKKPAAAPVNGLMLRTRRLAAAVELSNQAVHRKSRNSPECARMGTTTVCAWIGDGIASLAHVGDSRAYLWRPPHLEQLTRDHSLVEEQVRAGLLSREESLQVADQNALLRALGQEPEVEVDTDEVPLRPGDSLLLCTDGLTRMVTEAEMADALARRRQPREVCSHLVDLANRRGGVDNITVVVVAVRRETLWRRVWKTLRP